MLYNKSQIETYQENTSGNGLDLEPHTKIKRDAPSTVGDKICTTIYKSSCRTIFQERDVQEDVIDCQDIIQEVCEEIDDNCVLNCDPKCNKIPVKKCTTETKITTKYTPVTKCTKIPRKVCATRNAWSRKDNWYTDEHCTLINQWMVKQNINVTHFVMASLLIRFVVTWDIFWNGTLLDYQEWFIMVEKQFSLWK